jgi:threonine/homoserine/homoserine lactone efflux protein
VHFPAFLLETVLISLTGVMAPGPMTAATVGKGGESPGAGVSLSLGHGVIELPLMVLLYLGLGRLLGRDGVGAAPGLAGGSFMLYMGGSMLWSLRRNAHAKAGAVVGHAPLIAGILLTGANPYFLLWWLTVGGALITRAASFGLLGFGSFALVHWLCDLGWLSFLSVMSYRGTKVFGERFRWVVTAVSSAFLLLFAVRFIIDALASIIGS